MKLQEMSNLSLTSVVKLNSGASMPRLGFGVALSADAVQSVSTALEVGYRHIDSARHYNNESQVAEAIAKSSIPREDLFFSTKIMSAEHSTAETLRAVDDSTKRAGAAAGYFDLILLHDPKAGKEKRIEAYKALLKAKEEGKTKSIGVSSFGVKHLKEIEEAGLPAPSVNQIELHLFNQQRDIVAYCQEKGIIVQAFCPLARSRRLDDMTLVSTAESVQKAPAQVMIRWLLQKGFVPLPKSDTPSRIRSNADVYDFELSDDHMKRLDALDEGKAGSCSWNPVDAP